MRKLFLLFVALVTTTALLAHDFYSDGIYYNRIGNNCVEVTHPTNRIHDYSGSVVIPNEVYYSGTTYSVTTIGKNAFEFCSLTDITLPNSLTVIKDSAFFHCHCDSILIPNGVTTIESYAFYGSEFSSITIGDSVTSIGEWAFSSSSYISITIPKSVTTIGDAAFYECSSLAKIYYDGDIADWCNIKFESIRANPMYCSHNFYINNQEIEELVIPSSVTSIGYYTFSGCSSLTSLTIPNSVTSIGKGAFSSCTALSVVSIAENLITIDKGAFAYCSSLTSVTLPNSLTNIEYGAFYGCTSLNSITIPNSVMRIKGEAFYNTGIYNNQSNWEKGVLYLNDCLIKAKYKLFGNYIVKDNTRLIADDAFDECAVVSVEIPNSVTHIGNAAFYSCETLASVSIGSGVTHIGDLVFSDCDSLKTIYCHAIFPPYVDERTFFDDERETNRYNVTLYVPDEAWIDYKVHDIWGEFENIVPMSTASVENTHSQSPISNCQKILRNGQLIIVRDDVEYNAVGQEM